MKIKNLVQSLALVLMLSSSIPASFAEGEGNPHYVQLANALPNGTRFVATIPMGFAPREGIIIFYHGFLASDGHWPNQSNDRYCFLTANTLSDNYRTISEFTITELKYMASDGSLVTYNIRSPDGASGALSCVHPSTEDSIMYDEFLDDIGSLFNIILPQPDRF